jgi:threonine dehydrogenase-like Zn-dependent dehydrogenase
MTRRAAALEFARQAGAVVEVMDDHWRVLGACKGEGWHLGPEGADVVIECVGKQWPLDLATELVKEHGRLVIAGYHQDGTRTVNMQQWNWKGIDVINAHERRPESYVSGMHAAVEAVAGGRLQIEPLLTHRFPLERLAEALEMTISRPDGFLKAYVTL